MKDLIERLEQASGPDRELDLAIARAVNHLIYRIVGDTDPTALDYTDSIDAALTLVPDDFECEVGTGNDRMGEKPWASAWPKQQPFPVELEFYAEGATPELAASQVALKARQAMTEAPAGKAQVSDISS